MAKKSLAKRIVRSVGRRLRDSRYIRYYNKLKINEKTVLIESKQGQDIAGNMFYTLKEICENHTDFKVYLSVDKSGFEHIKHILDNYNIKNIEFVPRKSKQYYKLLASAKYLFNDTSFLPDFIKKEGQVYLNTWHGTPLKKMGKDVDNRIYAIGNIKRNFTLADYLVYPNSEMQDKMMTAYGIDNLYRGEVLNIGYPRNSIFFDTDSYTAVREKFEITDKQVMVYMPTWRGVMTKRKGDEQKDAITERMKKVDGLLNDNQVLYVKMHILAAQELSFDEYKHIKVFPEGVEAYEFLNAADLLITDYSSVFFDFANTGRKIVLYTYDEEEYMSTRGTYYSLDELPFPRARDEESLIREINSPKNYDDSEFLHKFCTFDYKDAPKDLVNYVLKGVKSDNFKIAESRSNNLPNTLVYSGNFAFNGITSSLLSLMSVIDGDKENFYFTFREKTLKREPLRLKRAPHFVDFFPLCGEFKYSIKEFLSRILFYKFNISNRFIVRSLDKAFSREFVRLYGNVKFDRVIHFTGYEKFITGFLERIDAKRAIFVHNDMVSEIREKGNQHKKTLIEAYARYDKVVPVSESARDSVLALAADAKDRITMLYNAYDYKRVLSLAEDDVHYDPSTVANVSEKVLKILLDRDATKFINIGRFSAEKGHDRLINAFERYYIDDPNSYLIIIGGYGPLYNKLQEKVRRLKCRYNVLFIRRISNPYAILKKCDLFILSSFYEALGLVLLEADTLKVPGISTDIGGTREFLQAHKGNLVENTEEGIYQGMLDFKAGKFSLLEFDPEEYNLGVKECYYKIFDQVN